MLTDQLRTLATCLFSPADIIETRYLPKDGGPAVSSQFFEARYLHRGMESIEHHNTSSNCYFGCNPRRAKGGTKAKDVSLARCLCVEWDETTWGDAWQRIAALRLPDPTMVLWSGSGPHVYWRLAEPITDLAHWSECQRALIRVLGSDCCIHDAPRIMRLPGTWNHKRGVAARILWADVGLRYSLDELMYRVPTKVEAPVQKAAPVLGRVNVGDKTKRALKYLEACPPAVAGQRGHSTAFRVIRSLVWGFDVTADEAISLLGEWNARCIPTWSEKELRHKIRESETKSFGKPRGFLQEVGQARIIR
jgi:hypothetical protein